MRIELKSSNQELDIKIEGKLTKKIIGEFIISRLDHAFLSLPDVNYNEKDGILTLKLKRNEYEKIKRKKFLWFYVWSRDMYSTRPCKLTIKEVEDCKIHNQDLSYNGEIVIAGPSISPNNEIYIGSFCEEEYSYGITLRVKRINMTLEDL